MLITSSRLPANSCLFLSFISDTELQVGIWNFFELVFNICCTLYITLISVLLFFALLIIGRVI